MVKNLSHLNQPLIHFFDRIRTKILHESVAVYKRDLLTSNLYLSTLQVGQKYKVYGWGRISKNGPHEFRAQQIKVSNGLMQCHVDHIKDYNQIRKSLLANKTICAGSSFCPVILFFVFK